MKEKKTESLPLIYLLGMPIIFIVANFLARTHIEILGSPLYFSVILYPLTYLISGLIVKKADYKRSLLVMAVTLITASLTYVVEWALLSSMDAYVMIYSFLSFLIGQLIFIYTFDFLRKIKKDSYGWMFVLTLVVTLIDGAFFGAIIEGQYVTISTLVRIIYVVAIPAILAKKTGKNSN